MGRDRQCIEGIHFKHRLPGSTAPGERHVKHGRFFRRPSNLVLARDSLEAMLWVLHQVATTWQLKIYVAESVEVCMTHGGRQLGRDVTISIL
eukprot:363017-Chlamydomonas_euryale.AAC.3